jgi:hypothetical protein
MLTKNTELLKREVQEHIASDSLIQGTYWNEHEHKGCFIGCLTHSDDTSPAVERFGLTEPILRIAEHIFEKLPKEEAKQFFAAFPDAIATDGKDLSLVHWKFLSETLRNLPPQDEKIQVVVDPVIAGMNILASGGVWNTAAARAAARAAYANAAAAAAYAAEAAACAAAADDAAACAAAFRNGAICRQRDSLMKIIQESPVTS